MYYLFECLVLCAQLFLDIRVKARLPQLEDLVGVLEAAHLGLEENEQSFLDVAPGALSLAQPRLQAHNRLPESESSSR